MGRRTFLWKRALDLILTKSTFLRFISTRRLAKKSIIYRDIKPENIGFNIHGKITLFDFGLPKELYEKDKLPDGTWKLSAKTGSLRFMAPEVFLGRPYNFSCDVFAFAVLLWSVLAMEKPYAAYSLARHEERVIRGGHRLNINPEWPSALGDLIARGWGEDITCRPSMKTIRETLQKEMDALED